MFKVGDVVFFKKGKKDSRRKSPEMEFNGHAFGVLLGVVPPGVMDPPQAHLFRLMGSVGFLCFDDVARFLGDEQAKECLKKFQDKYYPKPNPILNTNPDIKPKSDDKNITNASSNLVDAKDTGEHSGDDIA